MEHGSSVLKVAETGSLKACLFVVGEECGDEK